MSADRPTAREALGLQLAMVARGSELVEIRWRRPAGGMGQRFARGDRPGEAAAAILALGARTDVYIGAAPRTERDGSKRAIAHARCLWIDCDDQEAADRLRAFKPAPTFLLRSGRDGGLHGWWALQQPLAAPRGLERALRRLAHHLGGDMACCDCTRIMRPAGTLNHKHGQPRPVAVERLELDVFDTAAIVGDLPDPPTPARRPPPPTGPRPAGEDPLLAIPPPIYLAALTGRQVGRDGKIACPFHDDGTPSLHAYPTPERGWCCHAGCGGGTIIDFGARLYGLEPRGRGYHEIRERLEADLRAGATR